MPVTTTYQEIVDMGYAKSTKNQPHEIATNAVELLNLVHRTLSGLYSVAARFAPTAFAVISDPVSYAAPGWLRPEDAENVFEVQKNDGTEVTVPSFQDRGDPLVTPAVYELGGYFRPIAGVGDPATDDDLVFFYAKSPAVPVDIESTLDALWKESYNELLAYDLALYLSNKDGREEEFRSMTAHRNHWARLFVAYLEHHTSARISRFGTAEEHTNDMMKAIAGVLQPGSEAFVDG